MVGKVFVYVEAQVCGLERQYLVWAFASIAPPERFSFYSPRTADIHNGPLFWTQGRMAHFLGKRYPTLLTILASADF